MEPDANPPPRIFGLSTRAALMLIAGVALAVATVGAALAEVSDPDAFGSFGEALWWSMVTVGTVGYGDVVPTNVQGRVIASVMILFTMAFFPVLTGAVTAAFVSRAQRGTREVDTKDAEERQAEMLRHLRSIEARVARLEDRGRE